MTKKVTTSPEEKLEEAAKAVELHKIHEDDFFKTLGNSTEFDILCNGIDTKVGLNHKEAKQLCIDLVRRLEKLSKDNTSKYNDYCSYLRYWLYEKVGDIHTDKSVNVDDAPFFKHLIEAWKKMNSDKLKSKCAPGELKRVKLNELKNRIFSYIYFKNLEKIHNISASKKENDCTKYLTYLESFKPVHERRSKSFRKCNTTKSFSSCNKLIEFVNCCNYIACSKYNKSNNSVNSSNNHKHSNNTKHSHYNKYSNYNKYKKFINILIFIFFTKITNFYKYIEHKRFSKAGDYNKCTKYKRFAGYSNHKYTKCRRFN
ncbi:hypothetical protein PVMG_02535, partial [Plasmodium vivax Mauritania I]